MHARTRKPRCASLRASPFSSHCVCSARSSKNLSFITRSGIATLRSPKAGLHSRMMTPLLLLLPTPTLGFVAQAHALHAPSHTSHTPVMHLPAPVSSLCLTSLCAIAAEPSSVGMTGGNMDPGTAAIVSTYITATTAGLIVTAFTMLMGALGRSRSAIERPVSQEGDANDDLNASLCLWWRRECTTRGTRLRWMNSGCARV